MANAWQAGFRAAVRTNRRGWGVSNHYGKVRLKLQFPKTGNWPANAAATLPYPWAPGSINEVIQLCNLIYGPVMAGQLTLKKAIDDALSGSDQKQDLVVSPWPVIAEAFRHDKLTMRNQIKAATYEASYGRYLKIALQFLSGRNQPQTGKELADKVLIHKRTNQKAGVRFGEPLKPWINMPASRLECSLALKLFLEFAVHEHRQSQCWLISPREYEKLRGSSAKRRIKATLSDAECLQLFELLEEGWANVARLLRVFGLRMWEVNCLIVRTNADAEAQLFCSQGKVYTTRGVKRSNEPRWLEAVPVAGKTFELVGQIQRCELKLPIASDGNPMEITGANLGKTLRRLPYWQELVKQKAEQGEWLRPYSFRDTYSLVCESMQVHKADLCAAMGHSEEVHNRSYRTTSFRTMRDSFKQAFG